MRIILAADVQARGQPPNERLRLLLARRARERSRRTAPAQTQPPWFRRDERRRRGRL